MAPSPQRQSDDDEPGHRASLTGCAAGRKTTPMKDLTISLTGQPRALAALGESTGRANINIEGACAYVEDGKVVAHICVEDADGARRFHRTAARSPSWRTAVWT